MFNAEEYWQMNVKEFEFFRKIFPHKDKQSSMKTVDVKTVFIPHKSARWTAIFYALTRTDLKQGRRVWVRIID